MKWIDRPQYLQRLLGLQNTPDIKIITGIRRCGKSCLLRAFRQQIQRQDPAANILFLDFTDLDWEELGCGFYCLYVDFGFLGLCGWIRVFFGCA